MLLFKTTGGEGGILSLQEQYRFHISLRPAGLVAIYSTFSNPAREVCRHFTPLRIKKSPLFSGIFKCGGDVPKLEPRRLYFRSVDKIVRDLRRIYKENPTLFDIPTFAQKQY